MVSSSTTKRRTEHVHNDGQPTFFGKAQNYATLKCNKTYILIRKLENA